MEETAIQLLGIVAGVIAALLSAADAFHRRRRKKSQDDISDHDDGIHKKFQRVEQLLKEGKNKEAEEIFREAAPK
jgi:hypothetical protein